VSVVVEMTTCSSGRADWSISTSARVAFISPRLTAWMRSAGRPGSRRGTFPVRSRSARKTFRRATGRSSQNGLVNTAPAP
jgi:hypothetical protein